VVRNNAVADGIATNEIQAIVTKALNQPVPGVIVSFSTSNEANVVTANAETDSNGVATTTITSKKSGSTVVTASVNGTSQAVETNFIADAGSAEIAQGAFTVTVDNAVADGKATYAVQAIVTDATGNVVPDAAVKFSSPDAISVATPTTTTDAQGVATTTLTSTKAGSFTVNAEVNGKQSAVEVSFVVGPLDENKSSLTVEYNNLTSINYLFNKPSDSKVTLTLTLKDAEGNPITESEVQFKSSRKYTTISNVKNVGNGVYSATLTAERTGLLTPDGTVETLITTQIDGEESGLTTTVDIQRGQYNKSTPLDVAYIYTASQMAALLEEYETIYFYTADWNPPSVVAIESIRVRGYNL
jgi:adhesin/invasin